MEGVGADGSTGDGKSRSVTTRRIKNQRLAAGYSWAFSSLTASPGARAHYDRRRTRGDAHIAAQRNLFNRLLGCLHHCLTTDTTYDENTAEPPRHRCDPRGLVECDNDLLRGYALAEPVERAGDRVEPVAYDHWCRCEPVPPLGQRGR